MTITIQSTEKTVEMNGVPARIWEGYTANGIRVHCYVTRIAHDEDEPRTEEFLNDLKQHRKPSVEIEAIPMRMIL